MFIFIRAVNPAAGGCVNTNVFGEFKIDDMRAGQDGRCHALFGSKDQDIFGRPVGLFLDGLNNIAKRLQQFFDKFRVQAVWLR